jgi:hypothetical protein
LMFCPWLYTGTKELKPLSHNNILKHNTIIIAGKTIWFLIFNLVLWSDS